MRVWIATGIALVGLVGGCSPGPDPASRQDPGAASTPVIVIAHDNGSLPRRCGVRRSTLDVLAFIDAFNRGDASALDRVIAEEPHFQWFSSTEGHGQRARAFTPRGRAATLRYLATRSKAGERMHLVQVKVTHVMPRAWFPSITDDVSGVEYSVSLDAPDFAALSGRNRLATGKGGFGCSDGRLLAWSMGLDTANGRPAHTELLCRRASRVRQDPRRVIACSD
jgi:hypothetical protein